MYDGRIEPVSIPYENTALRGFYFRGSGASEKRPLLILNNGSDGSLLGLRDLRVFNWLDETLGRL